MAYVMLEDETASMELLCFNRVLERCGSYLAGEHAGAGEGR